VPKNHKEKLYIVLYIVVTELTEGKADSMAADASSVFPASDMSTLLNEVNDPSGSLEEFLDSWSDMTPWELDFPADMPPAVQPKQEAGVVSETAERPLPAYGNKMMIAKQQAVDQRYQMPGNWPQPPHQITQHVQPASPHVGSSRVHHVSARLPPPPHQQYNSVQQGHGGLTHNNMEIRNHMPPSQPCARRTVVPFGNMQPCQQRDVPGHRQYLQHQPPMMSNPAMQANHMRPMSPALQHSMVANQSAMVHGAASVTPMSNQLHNLQVMVNNQTSMMRHNRVNISPGLVPNGGGLSDPLMHAKMMHRSSTRMTHNGRHSAVPNEAHMFQSSEYLPPPNVMHQHQAQNAGSLQDQSVGMMTHPAAAGFHNQSPVPPLQHGTLHGQARPVVQHSHSMPNHTGMMANHPSMMPSQPELGPNHFPGRSHGMAVMSPAHRGMVHSSGPNRSQMGILTQQMMMPKQQQPVQMPHPGRNATMPQSQAVMDKNAAAFQWHQPSSTPNMMAQPPGVQNMAQVCNSPAGNQFPSNISPAACNTEHTLSSRQNNTPFTGDIDSLSFLSDPFLPQVSDDGYCGQQQMLQLTSAAGIDFCILPNVIAVTINSFSYYCSLLACD